MNGDVGEIFTDWLLKTYPDRSQKVIKKIKNIYAGNINDSHPGTRMKGDGIIAEMIHQQFSLARKLYRIENENFKHNLRLYTAPKTVQFSLF